MKQYKVRLPLTQTFMHSRIFAVEVDKEVQMFFGFRFGEDAVFYTAFEYKQPVLLRETDSGSNGISQLSQKTFGF